MTWWGHDLLSGDPPLDTLEFFGELIGEEELWPLDLSDEEASRLRIKIENLGDRILTHPVLGKNEHLPVVAAVYMATGAAMSDAFRAAALHAAKNDYFYDEWEDGGAGRAATMAALITMIEQHQPGKRVEIAYQGLLDTLEEKGLLD